MTTDLHRVFELSIAIPALAASAPVIATLMATMTIVNRSNPFFIQERAGLNGKPFALIKIKTMRDAFNEQGLPIEDHIRTTKTGRIVRRSKLDELPQLIHVITGKMSLVGPRPLTLTDPTTLKYPVRTTVKPGITGLAQLHQFNNPEARKKADFDLDYIAERNRRTLCGRIAYDAMIILKTPVAILKGWQTPSPTTS